MKYIDFTVGEHSVAEHYGVVKKLLNEGYKFTHNTFGNPHFHNFEDKSKEDVCILASISDDSGYFRI